MSVELPRDADGCEIPLDTEVLYDKNGQEIEVSRYQYYPKVGAGYWNIKSVRNKFYRQDEVYLTTPDSWEKLEEDLQRIDIGESGWFCMYAGYGKDDDKCYSECKFFKNKTPCAKQAARDIASRIRKLRGED